MFRSLPKFSAYVTWFLLLASIALGQRFETGKISMEVNIYGRVRVFYPDFDTRQIDRSSLLVATGIRNVFDYQKDAEVVDSVMTIDTPALSDYEIYASFDNSYNDPPQPPHVLVNLNVYGWNDIGGCIAKFTIKNRQGITINATIGMEMIAQINGTYGFEIVEYLADNSVIQIYRPDEQYTGYKVLGASLKSLKVIDWYTGYYDDDLSYGGWLLIDSIDPKFESGSDGAVALFTQQTINIPVNDETEFFVGIATGTDQSNMLSEMDATVAKYNEIFATAISGDSEAILPASTRLTQNYPNPFNPSTTIKFELAEPAFVSLDVFDIAGQKVKGLVYSNMNAGSHLVKFDAGDLPSGLYFYTLKANAFQETKRMLLIK